MRREKQDIELITKNGDAFRYSSCYFRTSDLLSIFEELDDYEVILSDSSYAASTVHINHTMKQVRLY